MFCLNYVKPKFYLLVCFCG